jgi:Glycosyltransferases, probably involved in cell wall biogenesis
MKISALSAIYEKDNAAFVRQALDSIFNQTYLPSEMILVKDGALTPEIEKVLSEYEKKYPILKIISLPTNQGSGVARYEGLKHCQNELIALMDMDDISKPDRFARQIQVFKKYPDCDVVGAWIDEFVNNINNLVSTRKVPETNNEIRLFAKSRCPINNPVVMFKKSAFLAVGGYESFMNLFEDYYLWVRMLLNKSVFYNIQESLLFFRISPDLYKRRGGWKYAIVEFRFQKKLLNLKFITFSRFLKNILIRIPVRLIPNRLRAMIYNKLLRKK